MKIGLIGDFDSTVTAHSAIPMSFAIASERLGKPIPYEWIPTEEINGIGRLKAYDGLWCVPASPYKNTTGVLLAIQYARESNIPFLGTCGGFQHAIRKFIIQNQ